MKQRALCVPHQLAFVMVMGQAAAVALAESRAAISGADGRAGSTPEPVSKGMGTGEQMRVYADAAPKLAVDCSTKALADAKLAAGEITHLVTVSCTGFFAPGLDLALINGLGLRPTVGRVFVGSWAATAPSTACVRRRPSRKPIRDRVLLCAVELCSLHYSFEWDPDRAVGNAIFADGAAGAGSHTYVAAPSEDTLQVAATGSCCISRLGRRDVLEHRRPRVRNVSLVASAGPDFHQRPPVV